MTARAIVLAVVLVLFGTWAYADECNSLRYVDNLDGTMTDCRTGLIWLQNADCTNTFNGIDNSSGFLSWYDAMKWVAALHDTGNPATGCGLTDGSEAGDWRLPTKAEWQAMIASAKKQDFTAPVLTNAAGDAKWTAAASSFINVPSFYCYWSSTTTAGDTSNASDFCISNGVVGNTAKVNTDKVWPVRGGQSGSFGSLIIE